jgi:hypothetical protein
MKCRETSMGPSKCTIECSILSNRCRWFYISLPYNASAWACSSAVLPAIDVWTLTYPALFTGLDLLDSSRWSRTGWLISVSKKILLEFGLNIAPSSLEYLLWLIFCAFHLRQAWALKVLRMEKEKVNKTEKVGDDNDDVQYNSKLLPSHLRCISLMEFLTLMNLLLSTCQQLCKALLSLGF